MGGHRAAKGLTMAEIQNILLAGNETEESVEILLSLTKLSSESMKKALMYHLVNGAADTYACLAFSVTQSNFSRDLKKLNDVARKIDKYFELNYRKSVK